jgi:glycosyltransferase involved in cell wall biosynthesis
MPSKVSVIIPVYNESKNLPLLNDAILDTFRSAVKNPWEVIYVDDGSTDESFLVLSGLANANPKHIRVVSLRRNYGQTAALSAGIDHADGEIIVLMDGDMQNDPADIPLLLAKIEEGYDLASGWRKNRQDAFITRTLPSQIANWLISKITGVKLHDYGCTLKAYRREILTGFRLYGEMHRFIPVFAKSVGANITEVVVKHHPRKFGKTNYGLERTVKVILDLFTVNFISRYLYKPIYLFGGSGMGFIALGVFGLTFLVLRKLFFSGVIADSPFFLVSIMFIIIGFQSILMGLIAEVVIRTYHESQAKPIYTIRKTIISDADE